MEERPRKVPNIDEFYDLFIKMRILMDHLNYHLIKGQKLCRDSGDAIPVCHVMTRVFARFTSNDFLVVDGSLTGIYSNELGEEYGRKAIIATEDLKPFACRFQMLHHSWLVYKNDPRFIVDILPLGSIPGLVMPLPIFLDEYAQAYTSIGLPKNVSLDQIEKQVDEVHCFIRDIVFQKTGVKDETREDAEKNDQGIITGMQKRITESESGFERKAVARHPKPEWYDREYTI